MATLRLDVKMRVQVKDCMLLRSVNSLRAHSETEWPGLTVRTHLTIAARSVSSQQ